MKRTPTITITKGNIASGKTFFANEQVDKGNGQIINICKDNLREMLDHNHHSKGRESFIIKVQEAIIDVALNEGKDVIVSDTNLNPSHEQRIIDKFGDRANIVVNDSFLSVPLNVCIERDKNRAKPIGEKAVRDMHRRYIEKPWTPLTQDVSLPKVAVYDIDGTLANHQSNGKDSRSPYDWMRVKEDLVNEHVKEMLLLHKNSGYKIVIVSGRDSVCRPLTIEWLNENSIPFDMLLMRKQNDNRPDDVVKEEIIDNDILPYYNIKAWVDDRAKVCRCLHKKGIPLFRVGDPDSDF